MNSFLSLFRPRLIRAVLLLILADVSGGQALAMNPQRDDLVILLRDEPLRLYDKSVATGRKGQVFTVLAYAQDEHRVYVRYKDAAGKISGLNVPEDALLLLPGRGEQAFRQGLDAVKAGRWADAVRELTDAAAANPEETLYADVRSRADALARSLLAVQQAQAARTQAGEFATQKRRNADLSDHVSTLDPTDHSGEKRAAQDREAAQKAERKAEENLKTATSALEAILTGLEGYVHQKIETKDYDVALAFASVRQRLTAGPKQGATLGSDEAGKYNAALNSADSHAAAATAAAAVSRLFTANREITEGLTAVPTHRGLNALKMQVGLRLAAVEEKFPEVDAARKKADHEGALRLVGALLTDCPDHPGLLERKADLTRILAERDAALASADAAEKARDYAKALPIYETYGRHEAVVRVLPLLAKQEENNGNFIRAVELYGRAGLDGEAARLTKNRQEQEEAYTHARVALAEEKYEEALAIYDRYKDDPARRAVLREKASHLMERNDYENALQAYRDAGAAEEIKGVIALIEERKKALAQGKDLETGARYDEALALYAKAAATTEVARLARKLAEVALTGKDPETAVAYYEMAGDYAKAGAVRNANHLVEANVQRKLDPQELYKRSLPATVTIKVRNGGSVAVGSGFFVTKKGTVLTNCHVVDDAGVVEVITSDYKKYVGKVLAKSDTPDLAVIQVDANATPYLSLSDSDRVQTGASVYAIGSPGGGDDGQILPGSFAQGMISNTNGIFLHNKVFQMTVLINHGNSGGPLLDERGNVVGVNTFVNGTLAVTESGAHIGSDIQGINFAIKINEARKILQTCGVAIH